MIELGKKEIKIVDVTLRDGGLVNDFYFSDEFALNLYEANLKAGIDYMEFGYKASKRLFSVQEYGHWKFCEEDHIRKIVNPNEDTLKICVMADVGRTDYKTDIIDKKDSVIDLIRVATYIDDIFDAVKMIEHIKEKGYEVTCNIMAVSTAGDRKLRDALKILASSCVDGVYIVDSYGALYPWQTQNLLELYMDIMENYGKFVGMHAHNNQQLAFANTIMALEYGVEYVDVSMAGIGRGAGNCATEQLVAYLNSDEYEFPPVCEFIQKNISRLKKEGMKWGYDFPYLVTGMLNTHPRDAINFIGNQGENYIDFYKGLYRKIK